MDDYEKARKLVRDFIESAKESQMNSDGAASEALAALAVMEDFVKTPPGHYKLFFGGYYVSGRGNDERINAYNKGQKMDGVTSVSFLHSPEKVSMSASLDIEIHGYNM